MTVPHYTRDPYGHIAVPNRARGFVAGYVEALPYVLGEGTVRRLARELADSIISDARTVHGPVVWLTGNACVPPIRSFLAAEYVYNADNIRDGELLELDVGAPRLRRHEVDIAHQRSGEGQRGLLPLRAPAGY